MGQADKTHRRPPITKKVPGVRSRPIPLWPATEDHPLLPVSLGGFGYLSDIEDKNESFAIQKTLFLGFPRVVAGGRDAHYQAIGWCISRKAVIVNRDVFSAGGQKPVAVAELDRPVILPAVMTKAITALNRRCPVSLGDLSEIHGRAIDTADSAIEIFGESLLAGGVLDELSTILSTRANLTRDHARRILAATLTGAVDTGGFVK